MRRYGITGLGFLFLITCLFLITVIGNAQGYQQSKTTSVAPNTALKLEFTSDGSVDLEIASTEKVNVYIVLKDDAIGFSVEESVVASKAVISWLDVTDFTQTVSNLEPDEYYYVYVYNNGNTDSDVTITVGTPTETVSPLAWAFCCCLPAVLVIGAIVVIIVIIIKVNAKNKKKRAAVASQVQKPQGAPPPVPVGQPPATVSKVITNLQQSGTTVIGQGPAQHPASQTGFPTGGRPPGDMGPTWSQQIFLGDVFKVDMRLVSWGYSYDVMDGWGRKIAYVKMKPFQWKETITFFTDETAQYPLITIQQENIADWSGSFVVNDAQSNQFLGIIKRNWARSMIQDEWWIKNFNRQEVGHVSEDSLAMGLTRRFMPFGGLVPNNYFINYKGKEIGVIEETFRVIGNEYTVRLLPGAGETLDRRLAVALVVMMAMFEKNKSRRR